MQPGASNAAMQVWLAVTDELASGPAALQDWKFLDQVILRVLASDGFSVVLSDLA